MSTPSKVLAHSEPMAGATFFPRIGKILLGWWTAYLNWRIDRLAATRLQRMSDRELKDIGVSRACIEFAVRADTGRKPTFPLSF